MNADKVSEHKNVGLLHVSLSPRAVSFEKASDESDKNNLLLKLKNPPQSKNMEEVWRIRTSDDDEIPKKKMFRILSASNHCTKQNESNRGIPDVLEMMFKFPDLARKRDESGCLPIHIASLKGHMQVVELLLELDPSFAYSSSSATGMTALHYAAIGNHPRILQALLDATGLRALHTRCAPSPQMPSGYTAGELAERYGHHEAVAVLGQRTVTGKDDQLGRSFRYLVRYIRSVEEGHERGSEHEVAAQCIEEDQTALDAAYTEDDTGPHLSFAAPGHRPVPCFTLSFTVSKTSPKLASHPPYRPKTLKSPRSAKEQSTMLPVRNIGTIQGISASARPQAFEESYDDILLTDRTAHHIEASHHPVSATQNAPYIASAVTRVPIVSRYISLPTNMRPTSQTPRDGGITFPLSPRLWQYYTALEKQYSEGVLDPELSEILQAVYEKYFACASIHADGNADFGNNLGDDLGDMPDGVNEANEEYKMRPSAPAGSGGAGSARAGEDSALLILIPKVPAHLPQPISHLPLFHGRKFMPRETILDGGSTGVAGPVTHSGGNKEVETEVEKHGHPLHVPAESTARSVQDKNDSGNSVSDIAASSVQFAHAGSRGINKGVEFEMLDGLDYDELSLHEDGLHKGFLEYLVSKDSLSRYANMLDLPLSGAFQENGRDVPYDLEGSDSDKRPQATKGKRIGKRTSHARSSAVKREPLFLPVQDSIEPPESRIAASSPKPTLKAKTRRPREPLPSTSVSTSTSISNPLSTNATGQRAESGDHNTTLSRVVSGIEILVPSTSLATTLNEPTEPDVGGSNTNTISHAVPTVEVRRGGTKYSGTPKAAKQESGYTAGVTARPESPRPHPITGSLLSPRRRNITLALTLTDPASKSNSKPSADHTAATQDSDTTLTASAAAGGKEKGKEQVFPSPRTAYNSNCPVFPRPANYFS